LNLRFIGSKVTSDAGLLAYRELDEILGLTDTGAEALIDLHLGSNKQHPPALSDDSRPRFSVVVAT